MSLDVTVNALIEEYLKTFEGKEVHYVWEHAVPTLGQCYVECVWQQARLLCELETKIDGIEMIRRITLETANQAFDKAVAETKEKEGA